MYICICNEITEQDLIETPELAEVVGSQCGNCKEREYEYWCNVEEDSWIDVLRECSELEFEEGESEC